MQLIDDPERARRLARAICADIRLYNAPVREAPPADRPRLLGVAVREGYELYVSRVVPAHLSLFEHKLPELYQALDTTYDGFPLESATPSPHPPVPERARADMEPRMELQRPQPVGGGSSIVGLIAFGALMMMLGGAAVLWFMSR